MKPIDALRSCESLFLAQLHEGEGGALEVVAKEARVGVTLTDQELAGELNEKVREVLRGARPIEHVSGCATFHIRWPSYISYAMLNETYALPEPATSISSGRVLVEYSASRFLDYLKGAMWGYDDYPGKWRHWELQCGDHVLQVASTDEPIIEVAHEA